MATATMEAPSRKASQPKPKQKMKFRLLDGTFTQHTPETKKARDDYVEEMRAKMLNHPAMARQLEAEMEHRLQNDPKLAPTTYYSLKSAIGYTSKNNIPFDPNTYEGDIIESEEDLAGSYNLRDEKGVPAKRQQCQIEGITFDFRKFARVGEKELRVHSLDQQPGESSSDYIARLQAIVDERKAQAAAGEAESKPVPLAEAKPQNGAKQADKAGQVTSFPELDKMNDKDLIQLAADEEIDISRCRDRDQRIKAIRLALQAKK